MRFFSIFGCWGLFWKLGFFVLPLILARSPLAAQESIRSMKSSNELIEAPRFFSSPLHQKWPRKILIVSGLDETEKDYEKLISLLEKESYQVGLYIPKSEDKNFDGDFSASQTEFVQFLKNWALNIRLRFKFNVRKTLLRAMKILVPRFFRFLINRIGRLQHRF